MRSDPLGRDGLEPSIVPATDRDEPNSRRGGRTAPAERPTAVTTGTTTVGAVGTDGVVLAARKRLRSPLLEPETVEKLYRVDDHVAVAAAGHAADARQLVDVARRAGQRHRLRYGEPIGIDALATEIGDHVQEHTQTGGSRPYGAALLVAGVDPGAGDDGADGDHGGSPALYEVDPGGTPTGWRAVAVGDGADEIRRFLEDRVADAGPDGDAPRTLRWGATAALEALATTTDEELTAETVDVWTVDATPAVDRYSDGDLDALLGEIDR